MTHINNLLSRKNFLIGQRETVRTDIKNLEGVRNSYTREIVLLQKRINTELLTATMKMRNK